MSMVLLTENVSASTVILIWLTSMPENGVPFFFFFLFGSHDSTDDHSSPTLDGLWSVCVASESPQVF